MSVKAISTVWERSKAKGSNLLVLLAIADYAKDSGRDAWPSFERLAQKSRLTERAVRLIISKLVDDGELAIEPNDRGREPVEGYKPKQFYHIVCCENFSESRKSLRKSFQPGTSFFSDLSEESCTPYKEDPSVHPSEENKSAPATPSPHVRLVEEHKRLFRMHFDTDPKQPTPGTFKMAYTLVERFQYEQARELLGKLFTTRDKFLHDSDHQFSTFYKFVDKLIVEQKNRPLPSARPADANTARREIRDANVTTVGARLAEAIDVDDEALR